MKAYKVIIAATLGSILFCGCTYDRYSSNGIKFARFAVGNKTSISAFTVDADTNGVKTLSLKGYQNDQAQVAGAVTEAAIRAAIQGAKTIK